MKKIKLVLMLLFIVPLLISCGSNEADKSAMKASIQMEAKDKGYSNAKWPFFEEDWHFEKQPDGNYKSHGTFTSDGTEYDFSAEVEPDGMLLDFYAE